MSAVIAAIEVATSCGLEISRIDSNKRATRLLLASFPLAFLPVVSASTVLLWVAAPSSLFVSLIVSALLLIVAVASIVAGYGPDLVLRIARARPLGPGAPLRYGRDDGWDEPFLPPRP